jgi:hypothetical protein
LGTLVHEHLQEALVSAFPDASIEHVVGAEHDERFGFPVSGRTDAYLVIDTGHGDVDGPSRAKRIVIEVKTMNGFAFKKAIGARGAAEGPRTGAIFQTALNMAALDADEAVVVLVSMECLSDRELVQLVRKTGGEADPVRKFVAEWTYSRADLDDLIGREIKRLDKIMAMVDADFLPPRSIPLQMPPSARVTDPSKGTWSLVIEDAVVQAGETWLCQYCSYQDKCTADGAS